MEKSVQLLPFCLLVEQPIVESAQRLQQIELESQGTSVFSANGSFGKETAAATRRGGQAVALQSGLLPHSNTHTQVTRCFVNAQAKAAVPRKQKRRI
ncbi:MAG: hypothetical protein ACRD8A_18335 [Candidatus Acidiferrales bacterium]